jgi:hypothetical protein
MLPSAGLDGDLKSGASMADLILIMDLTRATTGGLPLQMVAELMYTNGVVEQFLWRYL